MSAFRIQAYITREIVANFFLSLTLFTFIVLLSRLIKLADLVIGSGVSLMAVGNLFLAMMPSFLLITIPLSFLLAVLLTFARMSAESEIVAMKACGISIYTLSIPVFFIAICACATTAFLTTYAEPVGRIAMRDLAISVAMDKASSAVKAQQFNEEFPGLTIFADNVYNDSNALEGVFISDSRIKGQQVIITAKTGALIADDVGTNLLLHLNNGSIHKSTNSKNRADLQVINFTTYDINISLESAAAQTSSTVRPKLQTLPQLFTSLEQEKTPGGKQTMKYHELKAEIFERLIMPLSPLLFSLVGIPLGISSHRSNKGAGFAIALSIFMLYYLLFSTSKTLAIEENWNVALTMLAPNMLFAGAGIYLFAAAAREQGINPAGLINQCARKLLSSSRRSG